MTASALVAKNSKKPKGANNPEALAAVRREAEGFKKKHYVGRQQCCHLIKFEISIKSFRESGKDSQLVETL